MRSRKDIEVDLAYELKTMQEIIEELNTLSPKEKTYLFASLTATRLKIGNLRKELSG